MAKITKAPEVNGDPWKDMRTITLPRHGKNEQNFQFVSVNDRTYQVPRNGKPQRVPAPVYEVLINAQRARDYAENRSDDMLLHTEGK